MVKVHLLGQQIHVQLEKSIYLSIKIAFENFEE